MVRGQRWVRDGYWPSTDRSRVLLCPRRLQLQEQACTSRWFFITKDNPHADGDATSMRHHNHNRRHHYHYHYHSLLNINYGINDYFHYRVDKHFYHHISKSNNPHRTHNNHIHVDHMRSR